MALSKTVVTNHGLEAPNAYHRVDTVTIYDKQRINFVLHSHLKKENSFFNSATYSCAYDLDGSNPIKQAYAYLKNLPEFAGATDC
jgi:hypothetical protein